MALRELKPDEWESQIGDGLDYRRQYGIEKTWGQLESMFYNVHPSMANDGPNVLLSTGDAILADTTIPQPYVTVKPERPEAVDPAPLVEALDNTLLREMGVDGEVETAQLHAYLWGGGFVKIGFDSEYGYDPSLDAGGVLRLGFTLSQLSQKGDRRLEHDSSVVPGMPWVRAVPPHDIVLPWGTKEITDCPWISHRFVRQIDELKADPKYSNTRNLVPTLSMQDFVGSYKSMTRMITSMPSTRSMVSTSRRPSMRDQGDSTIQFVELYEIHDRRTGRIKVIAPGFQRFLRDDINALQIENRLPFASISFTPKARTIWTTPDAYYLQATQIELSDLAVQRAKIRRLAVLKFLYNEDMISDEEFEKLLSPDVGAAAKVSGGDDIRKAIMAHQTHPDQGLILEEEHLRRNAREQIGFSRNQLGEFSGGRRTAFEAGVVQQASQKRMSRRGKAVKKLYARIIEIVNGIVFTHWKRPRWVEVIGADQASQWLQISGPEIASRYSYSVELVDELEVRQRGMEALQLYMALREDPAVDPVGLAQFLSDRIGDPSFKRIFNAQIQNAMRAMRLASGVLDAQGGGGGGQGGQASPLSQLSLLQSPGANGTGLPNGGDALSSALALRGANA